MTREEKILKIYNKKKLVNGFDYDVLLHYPLSYLFHPTDYDQLRYIATSAKLMGKPKLKYQMIDDVMRYRGFTKLHAGTNRVVYKSEYDPTIVIKVGFDKVGITDNLAEMEAQELIKPFCCKIFDVTPCGTVAMVERVEAIQNRYQFEEIAEEVFDIVMSRFAGLVMEDIGCNFFMNWGIRKGFGPVVLDYPYTYILDGDKLTCTVRDKVTGMPCNGLIDYDMGLNTLICERCGSRYSARELKSNNKSLYSTSEKIKKELDEMEKFVVRTVIHGKEYVVSGKEVEHNAIQNKNVFVRVVKASNNIPKVVKKEEPKVELPSVTNEVVPEVKPEKVMEKPKRFMPEPPPNVDPNPDVERLEELMQEDPEILAACIPNNNSKGERNMSVKASMKKEAINKRIEEISNDFFTEFANRTDVKKGEFNTDHARELTEFCTPTIIKEFGIDENSAKSIITEWVYTNCEVDEVEEEVNEDDKYAEYDVEEERVQKIRNNKLKDY